MTRRERAQARDIQGLATLAALSSAGASGLIGVAMGAVAGFAQARLATLQERAPDRVDPESYRRHRGGPVDNVIRRFHEGGAVAASAPTTPAGETGVEANVEGVLRARDAEAMRLRIDGSQPSAQSRQTALTIVNLDDPDRIREVIASNPDVIVNAINRRLPQIRRMIRQG